MKPSVIINNADNLIEKYLQDTTEKYKDYCIKLKDEIQNELDDFLNKEFTQINKNVIKNHFVSINTRSKFVKEKPQVLRKVLKIIGNEHNAILKNCIVTNDYDKFKEIITKYIFDFSGLEIIFPYRYLVIKFAENLKSLFNSESNIGTFVYENNYFESPQVSGYRAIHYIIEVEELPFEIQLKTNLQSNWSRYTHDLTYKLHDTMEPSEQIQTRYTALAELFSVADIIVEEIFNNYLHERHSKSRKIGPL